MKGDLERVRSHFTDEAMVEWRMHVGIINVLNVYFSGVYAPVLKLTLDRYISIL